MKTITIALLLVIESYCQTQCLFENFSCGYYYHRVAYHLEENTTISNCLKWSNYRNIKMETDFTGAPSYLPNSDQRFSDAIDFYHEINTDQTTYLTITSGTSNGGVQVFFSDDTRYFSNPQTNLACSQSCVANDRFVSSCTLEEAQLWDAVLPGSPRVTRARIVINKSSSFPTTYLSSEVCEDVPVGKYGLTMVFIHEMGHILGLPHCYNIEYCSFMYDVVWSGPDQCFWTEGDEAWLISLIISNPFTN